MSDNNNADGQGSALPEKMQSEAALLLAEIETTEAEPEAPAADAMSQDDINGMLSGLFFLTFNQVIAPRRGKHWSMTEAECVALGDAYGALIEKYFPDLRAGPEVAAVMVSITVFGPRVAQDVVLARQANKPTDDNVKESSDAPTVHTGEAANDA